MRIVKRTWFSKQFQGRWACQDCTDIREGEYYAKQVCYFSSTRISRSVCWLCRRKVTETLTRRSKEYLSGVFQSLGIDLDTTRKLEITADYDPQRAIRKRQKGRAIPTDGDINCHSTRPLTTISETTREALLTKIHYVPVPPAPAPTPWGTSSDPQEQAMDLTVRAEEETMDCDPLEICRAELTGTPRMETTYSPDEMKREIRDAMHEEEAQPPLSGAEEKQLWMDLQHPSIRNVDEFLGNIYQEGRQEMEKRSEDTAIQEAQNSESKCSYTAWPLLEPPPWKFTAAGFIHVGPGDRVKCTACQIELENWRPHDDPMLEHWRWSSQCPFLYRVSSQTPRE